MTIAAFLHDATAQLTASGVLTARLDCLILLEDALGKNRASLLAHTEQDISSAQLEQLQLFVARRCAHEPLAYIRGHAMFFGRSFTVDPSVLVPRPETELIIEAFLQHIVLTNDKKLAVADIGTGSGCIGITIALEQPNTQVDLYDISDDALKIARKNAAQLNARVGIHKSDLLMSVAKPYDVIVTNLPYVPDGFPINTAASREPKLALFSGADGLRDYQTFWQQIDLLKYKPSYIITEAFPNQHHALATMARHNGYALEYVQDFVQLFVCMQ